MRTLSCFACAVLLVAASSAQIGLVKDVNARPFPNPSARPESLASTGGWTYFTVQSQRATGAELYRARGTPPALELVKDIRPGPEGSSPRGLVAVGTSIWFAADDGVHGSELWTSDGTTAGTHMVQDVLPGPGSSYPSDFTDLGGTIFFSAYGAGIGRELWKTDGTANGTTLVADIAAGPLDSLPSQLTRFGNVLLFQASDSAHGSELWRTDGSAAGTTLVVDLWPGNGLNFGNSRPSDLTVMGGVLYFIAATATGSTELWRSDGSTAGTTLVRAFVQALVIPNRLDARILGVHAGRMWLAANDGSSGQELFTSDGTAQGTALVLDINPTGSSVPQSLVPFGNDVLFSASAAVPLRGLWRSDGTAGGTTAVKDFPGSAGPRNLTPIGGAVLFNALEPAIGAELWRSDGTPNGTFLVTDIQPGSVSSSPESLHAVSGAAVLFSADDGVHGAELWSSDGTAAGTVLLADIDVPEAGTDSALIENITPGRGRVYLTASDGIHGNEPWYSDGTAAGTSLLKDIMPGATKSSAAADFVTVGGTLFFSADDGVGVNGRQVWRSDGTPAGTARVTNLMPTQFGLNPINLTAFRHEVWFFGDVLAGTALYRTDGTTTFEVRSFPGRTAGRGNELRAVGDTLFFAAYDPLVGYELWKTDGTAAGTVLVKDIVPGATSSSPSHLHAWRGEVWFAAYAGSTQVLWRSDGTAAGTVQVASFAYPQAFCTVGDTLFIATSSAGLWRTDGTAAGTVPLGAGFADGRFWLESLGDRLLLFAGNDQARGCELWSSDGTPAGTRIIRDLLPGAGFGLESRPRAIGSRYACFTATDGVTGLELWVTDGTPAGTALVQDLMPGAGDGLPPIDLLTMGLVGGRLLFGARLPSVGHELCALDPGASAKAVGDGCGSGRFTPQLAATDPVLGLTMLLDGRAAPAPTLALVLAGVPDPNTLWLGDDCYSTLDLLRPWFDLGVLSLPQARWTVAVGIPNDGALVGVHLALQTWHLAPSAPRGFELSNGVLLTLGR